MQSFVIDSKVMQLSQMCTTANVGIDTPHYRGAIADFMVSTEACNARSILERQTIATNAGFSFYGDLIGKLLNGRCQDVSNSDFASFSTQLSGRIKQAKLRGEDTSALFFHSKQLENNVCLVLGLACPEEKTWLQQFVPLGQSYLEFVTEQASEAFGKFHSPVGTFALGKKLMAQAELMKVQGEEDQKAESGKEQLQAGLTDIKQYVEACKAQCKTMMDRFNVENYESLSTDNAAAPPVIGSDLRSGRSQRSQDRKRQNTQHSGGERGGRERGR